MGSMSPIHWLVVLGIAVLFFGGSRLSSVGKGLGEGIKNFKKGLADDPEEKPQAAPAPKQIESSGEPKDPKA